LIVNYHYCSPAQQALPGLKGVTPEDFTRQLARLTQVCERLGPADMPLAGAARRPRAGYLVTFDDGGRDIFVHAVPAVRKHSAPAIIFLCALPYMEERVLNVQKTHLLQGRWGWPGLRTRFMAALAADPGGQAREDVSSLGLDRMYRYDDAETAAFKRLLNVELPYPVLDRVLDRLFEAEFGPQGEVVKHLYMSLDDVKRCVDWGIAIGLHTYSHPMLSRLTRTEQAREIDVPLDYFRKELGLPVETVSYPYGIRGSWNEDTKTLAASRGLRAGFTLGRKLYEPVSDTDPFEIPRYDVNDVFTNGNRLQIDV
jgi:hypothetical protein